MTAGHEHDDDEPEAGLTAPTPETCVVHVRGDMDLDHAEELRSALLFAVSHASRDATIDIDLRNSSFCDSSGLGVLLAARRRAEESGHVLRLTAPSHQMLRLLALSDSAALFPVGPAT
ncbi:STAS domain-containing protein [Streptomyces sp. NPDC060031]|uniref:STAS domain-containing protein n=1 Tax=Streptomyces sp. NPDC060031 TaxID=3347043 RepID=UPI0036787E7E